MKNKFYYTILPLNLVYDEQYSALSLRAIVLYTLMLNRIKLSFNNISYQDDGGTYIYFSNPQIQKVLRCNQDSARRAVNELEEVGLIRKEYQKRGLPLKIYVNDVFGIHNRTYNKALTQDKPKINHNQNFKPYSPAVPKQQEKEVSFDIEKTRQQANDGALDFGNMKNKKRRHTSTFQY